MGSIHRKAKHRRHLTPLDWPSWTDEHIWNLVEPAGPTEADARWAAESNLEWHTEEPTPPEVIDAQAAESRDAEEPDFDWDQAAGEADAQDRLDRGFSNF